MVVSQLAPETTRDELAEYFAAHHAKLVSLLPEDTTCKDLVAQCGHVACGFGVGYLPAPLEALLPGATGYLPT